VRQSKPPRPATWMLNHLAPPGCDEALAGDLLEDFNAGRSSTWYWRQVLTTTAIRWFRSLADHRFALFFAAAWSLLSPAWQIAIVRLYHTSNLIGYVWRLPWPWSTVCMFGLSLIECAIFPCAGALLCLLPLALVTRSTDLRRIARAFAMSLAAFTVVWACEVALSILVVPRHPVDWRTLTMYGAIENFGIWAFLARLPYFVGTAWALCAAIPTTRALSAKR
jgi:hypothetical protein